MKIYEIAYGYEINLKKEDLYELLSNHRLYEIKPKKLSLIDFYQGYLEGLIKKVFKYRDKKLFEIFKRRYREFIFEILDKPENVPDAVKTAIIRDILFAFKVSLGFYSASAGGDYNSKIIRQLIKENDRFLPDVASKILNNFDQWKNDDILYTLITLLLSISPEIAERTIENIQQNQKFSIFLLNVYMSLHELSKSKKKIIFDYLEGKRNIDDLKFLTDGLKRYYRTFIINNNFPDNIRKQIVDRLVDITMKNFKTNYDMYLDL